MQPRKLKFMPAWVDALKPEPAIVEYRDAERPGLVLRVEVSGKKSWYARYTFAGRDRRYRIGPQSATTLKAARTAARTVIALAASGTDPQVERERLRIGIGVNAGVAAWLEDAKLGPLSKWKGGLTGGSARSFLPHIRRFQRELGTKLLAELTPRDVEVFVSDPEAAATRNRALTALRGFFWWAGRKGLVQADPTAALEKERETERARVLTADELRALVVGFDGTRYARAVRLLALTGLRRDEVMGARWSWLDADAGTLTIPPEAEKTGRTRGEPRRVALSPQAVALLAEQRAALFAEGVRSDFIFSTTTGERPHGDSLKPTVYLLRGRRSNGQPVAEEKPAKADGQRPRKKKRAKVRSATLPDDVTIHDVRRTVADALLNRLGAAPWVVDHVVLGHVRPKLLRTYMPVLPLDEARAALSRWADELQRIVSNDAAARETK
jgi:integrase